MNRDDLSPLSEDLQRLLAGERSAPSIPQAAQDRIAARLASSLARPPGAPEDSAEPGEPGAGDVGSMGDVGGAAAGSAAQLSPLATLAAKPLLLASLAFGVGAGSGVVGTVLYTGSEAPPHALPIAAPAPVDAGPIAMSPADAAHARTAIDAGAKVMPIQPARVPNESTRGGRKDQSLAAERSLLELSRTAITRGDAATALRELETHEKMHRRGRLAEERDALWVQALVLSGDMEQARRKGQAFKSRYPQSLFLPVIDHVLAESP